ncbi:hypothetical protein F53441_6152 [Fusarium austroafricanum]|uniref:DUF6594 domain-containing protein n=1 Tax=Fusarium austroafricanum TaxID=2364996 RepID=A0A8H4KGF5_9HYPO|nr:hypothetical protein F53441_6152 [Fusarium austroafricanum]
MIAVKELFQRLQRACFETSDEENSDPELGIIEDHIDGYPQFTALIASHRPWFMCRRFDRLRARLLLIKQDKLTVLEQKLREIDKSEETVLFLGMSRVDQNQSRLSTLSEIETALEDYDAFVERAARTFNLMQADRKDIKSLQNWVASTGSIAKDETEYLLHKDELVTPAPVSDNAVKQLESWVESKLTKNWREFRTVRGPAERKIRT